MLRDTERAAEFFEKMWAQARPLTQADVEGAAKLQAEIEAARSYGASSAFGQR